MWHLSGLQSGAIKSERPESTPAALRVKRLKRQAEQLYLIGHMSEAAEILTALTATSDSALGANLQPSTC